MDRYARGSPPLLFPWECPHLFGLSPQIYSIKQRVWPATTPKPGRRRWSPRWSHRVTGDQYTLLEGLWACFPLITCQPRSITLEPNSDGGAAARVLSWWSLSLTELPGPQLCSQQRAVSWGVGMATFLQVFPLPTHEIETGRGHVLQAH